MIPKGSNRVGTRLLEPETAGSTAGRQWIPPATENPVDPDNAARPLRSARQPRAQSRLQRTRQRSSAAEEKTHIGPGGPRTADPTRRKSDLPPCDAPETPLTLLPPPPRARPARAQATLAGALSRPSATTLDGATGLRLTCRSSSPTTSSCSTRSKGRSKNNFRFSLHGFDGVVPLGEKAARCDA